MPIWTVAHFLDPMKTYIFTQNIFFSLILAYWDESLEEIVLMFTGHWGWFGSGDYRGIEPRYNTLISDPVLSAPLSVLQGYVLMSSFQVDPLFTFLSRPFDRKLQNFVLVLEHLALGRLWFLSKDPNRQIQMFDFGNWKLAVLGIVFPLAVMITYAFNYWLTKREWLKIYTESNHTEWFQIHVGWSIVSATIIFVCYVNPIPSPQLTAMLASVISILGLAYYKKHKRRIFADGYEPVNQNIAAIRINFKDSIMPKPRQQEST